MRIAVFTDADFDRPGSVTTALGALLRHAPPDVRPRIYSFSDLDVDEPEYLALRSSAVPMPVGWPPMYVPRIRELERRLVADDVRAIHMSTPGPAGLTARYLARRTGLPLVGSIQTSWIPHFSRIADEGSGRWRSASVVLQYLRWLYDGCSTVLVPFADAVRPLASAGWDATRLVVWPAGVDANAFSPARRSRRLREEWHVSEKRPAILCVGRLDQRSDVGLIEPLGSLLHRQGIAHRFVVVGEGTEIPRLRESCRDAVFSGHLSQRNLATVMASADLLLWPSEASTSGLVLLEAQASGLPVVAASGGSALEYLRPGVTSAVCRPHDVLGFCARAAELLTDAGRRRIMGGAGRRYALSRSWPASLDRVYALYRAVEAPAAVEVRVRRAPVSSGTVRVER
jgi:phosphatidylinositol alpha 1,6-mannosyltransferase